MDAFSILGVTPDHSPTEIKRAFRRLAMRWHPDRNDHPEAGERFKQIRAAYDFLLERADSAETINSSEANEEAEDSGPRAADISLSLEITLEEAAAGCRRTVQFERGACCPTCAGSGEHGMARTRLCQACFGSGRRRGADRTLVPCDTCSGRGFITERVCPSCQGSGRDLTEVVLEIVIPPGMLPGDDLRLVGQGEPGEDGNRNGNLYLTLAVGDHSLFKLQGRDIHFSMPVSGLAMICGGEIGIPSLAGPLAYRLAEGVPEGRTIRLAGKGYPGRNGSPPGDLVVEFYPVFPGRLTEHQRKLLEKANAALMDDAGTLVELAAWRKANGLG